MDHRDLFERVAWTAVQAVAGVLVAWQFDSPGLGAAVTTLAALVKNVARQKLQRRGEDE